MLVLNLFHTIPNVSTVNNVYLAISGAFVDDLLVSLCFFIGFSYGLFDMLPILSAMTERILVDTVPPVSERTIT